MNAPRDAAEGGDPAPVLARMLRADETTMAPGCAEPGERGKPALVDPALDQILVARVDRDHDERRARTSPSSFAWPSHGSLLGCVCERRRELTLVRRYDG